MTKKSFTQGYTEQVHAIAVIIMYLFCSKVKRNRNRIRIERRIFQAQERQAVFRMENKSFFLIFAAL